MAGKILVVDDEYKIRKVIKGYLEKEGYETITAEDGKEALEKYNNENPDLIILDLMLPELSGEEVCSKIRHNSDIPIIMLTAKGQEEDRIEGLDIGADDYVIKPFSPRELMARVRAILRRSDYEAPKAEYMSYLDGDLKIFPNKMQVTYKDEIIVFTSTEFDILTYLARHPGQVLSRDQLVEQVLGLEFKGFDRTIDAHIKNIRKKLNITDKKFIKTVYGAGYKFVGE
ncbi:MAG TPA: response regulator transcription factor [Halanaerobiales bacterium]|nr:response regulator transcription factor [Halanaerobiales bacterium]